MSDFKRAQSETRGVEIKAFKPKTLGGEAVDYAEIKKQYGSLAITDEAAHPSFRLNASSKKSLGVEHEEKSHVEGMVRGEVEARLATLREEAHEAGFNEGKKVGIIEAKAEFLHEMNPVLDQFKKLISELDQTRDDLFKANEKVLIELFLQVSKRVLLKDIAQDRDYILRLLSDIMERVGVKENIRIEIGKADFENLDRIKDFVKVQFPEMKNVQIEVNEALGLGGCVVETDLSSINASVDTQFNAIASSLGTA